jgi:hypothetical protein
MIDDMIVEVPYNIFMGNPHSQNISLVKVKEKWKPVPDYDGLYSISNFGRVKSHERFQVNHSKMQRVPEKILKPGCTPGDYLYVTLCKNHKFKSFTIHRMVGSAFLGWVYGKNTVNHKDGVRRNNFIWNLEWANQRENVCHGKVVTKSYSKYVGVSWEKKNRKWRACIHVSGNKIHLGMFSLEEEAAEAYRNALKMHNLVNEYA